MRVLIVDDEEPARHRLRQLLRAEPDVDVVAEAANGEQAAALIDTCALDVVFLDVQMPCVDGFGALKRVTRADLPSVIFVTAHEQYALKAFEVQALDYLLKPVSPERLRKLIARIRLQPVIPRLLSAVSHVERAIDRLAAPVPLEHLLLEHDGRAVFVPVREIDYIRADRNYVTVYCGTATYTHRSTLQAMCDDLGARTFLRINRSELVRLDAIREMYAWSHGDYRVLLKNGITLTWGRRYRRRVRR